MRWSDRDRDERVIRIFDGQEFGAAGGEPAVIVGGQGGILWLCVTGKWFDQLMEWQSKASSCERVASMYSRSASRGEALHFITLHIDSWLTICSPHGEL